MRWWATIWLCAVDARAMAAAAAANPACPRWFSIIGQNDDGSQLKLDAKAWVYRQTSEVYWELRRIVLLLTDGRFKTAVKTSRHYKRRAHLFEFYFEHCGIDIIEKEVVPSVRQIACLSEEGDDELINRVDRYKVRDEISISTRALVLMLLGAAVHERQAVDRERARNLLVSILQGLVPTENATRIDFQAPFDGGMGRCPHVGAMGRCAHYRLIEPFAANRLLALDIVRELEAMAAHVVICPGAAASVDAVTRQMALLINAAIPDAGSDDVRKQVHVRGPSRLLRVDEDFKKFALETSVLNGSCRSTRDAVQIDKELSSGCDVKWVDQKINAHLAHVWDVYDSAPLTGVYSLGEDGARLGNPGEENTVYSFYDHGRKSGFWLPPMAPSSEFGVWVWLGAPWAPARNTQIL
jgi:hypothetical protein